MEEAGFKNCVSVPGGAPPSISKEVPAPQEVCLSINNLTISMHTSRVSAFRGDTYLIFIWSILLFWYLAPVCKSWVQNYLVDAEF